MTDPVLEDTDPASGLELLLDRGWGQEVVHRLVLRELLGSTDLATRLGLWSDPHPPQVMYQPLHGLFDLGLAEDDRVRVLIEIKASTGVAEGQRRRQQVAAEDLGVVRAYLLLGVGFWAAHQETGIPYIGAPGLHVAVESVAREADGAVGDLARTYARRLAREAAAWTRGLDQDEGATGLLRTYTDIAAAWPVEARPFRVTNRAGPDWILNPDAWTAPELRGWEQGRVYWELVNGRVRYKVEWRGAEARGLQAREAFRQALEASSTETGIPFRTTRRRAGRGITAGEFPEDVVATIVVNGRVDPALARDLYEEATRLFQHAVSRLGPLPDE